MCVSVAPVCFSYGGTVIFSREQGSFPGNQQAFEETEELNLRFNQKTKFSSRRIVPGVTKQSLHCAF